MHMPIPDKIRNAPELRMGLQLYLDAFYDLNTDRPSGWSLMPIPRSAIRDYAVAHDFTDEQKDSLLYHIPLMDQAFRKHHAEHKSDGS